MNDQRPAFLPTLESLYYIRRTCLVGQRGKKGRANKMHFQIYPCKRERCLSSTQRQEVLASGGGVLIEWERLHLEPESLAAARFPAGAAEQA